MKALGPLVVALSCLQIGLLAQPGSLGTEPALSGEQRKGRRIFQQKCAVCHLPIVPSGAEPYASPLDGALIARDENHVRRVIANGSASGMPGWKHTLRPEQIDALRSKRRLRRWWLCRWASS